MKENAQKNKAGWKTRDCAGCGFCWRPEASPCKESFAHCDYEILMGRPVPAPTEDGRCPAEVGRFFIRKEVEALREAEEEKKREAKETAGPNPAMMQEGYKVDYRAVYGRYKEGLNDRRLAEEFGVSNTTILKWRQKYGLPANDNRGKRR